MAELIVCHHRSAAGREDFVEVVEMDRKSDNRADEKERTSSTVSDPTETCRAACPVCQGRLIEIRGKLQCSRCHTICETCCEGGRG